MVKAVTAVQMKEIDRLAQDEYGIPSTRLMENAGIKSAEEIQKDFKSGRACVCAGCGNNGGDGFVCARILKNYGIEVDIFLIGLVSDIKNEAPLINFRKAEELAIPLRELTRDKDAKQFKKNFCYSVIVDAIFGIGFKGALPKSTFDITSFLNKTSLPIYALDIPSGMDATTGTVSPGGVKAFKTVTFGLSKTGFYRNPLAKEYTGKVIVKDIGIPTELLKKSNT